MLNQQHLSYPCIVVLMHDPWYMHCVQNKMQFESFRKTQQCIFAQMAICNFEFKCLLLLSVNKNANLCFFFPVFLPLLLLLLIAASAVPFQQVMWFFLFSYPYYSARFRPANNSVKDISNGSYLIDMTLLRLGKHIYYSTILSSTSIGSCFYSEAVRRNCEENACLLFFL